MMFEVKLREAHVRTIMLALYDRLDKLPDDPQTLQALNHLRRQTDV